LAVVEMEQLIKLACQHTTVLAAVLELAQN
jgi:hypothetical protein